MKPLLAEVQKDMLETEWKFFKEHENELVHKYDGKAIVIVGEKVVGEYPNALVAYTEARPAYPSGTFLIQRCSVRNLARRQTLRSRINSK
ncbi:MAG: hypothetical protein ACLP05_03955 [Candidatus Kryptoniota bacterium]